MGDRFTFVIERHMYPVAQQVQVKLGEATPKEIKTMEKANELGRRALMDFDVEFVEQLEKDRSLYDMFNALRESVDVQDDEKIKTLRLSNYKRSHALTLERAVRNRLTFSVRQWREIKDLEPYIKGFYKKPPLVEAREDVVLMLGVARGWMTRMSPEMDKLWKGICDELLDGVHCDLVKYRSFGLGSDEEETPTDLAGLAAVGPAAK